MTKKQVYPAAAFILAFLSHAAYFWWSTLRSADPCAQSAAGSLAAAYFGQQEYFLGFSYALAAAFTVYALLKFAENRKRAAAGVAGGLALSGGLYAAACFLLGCCGSPLLAVYLGFLGASYLSFAKPLIAAITLLSVVGGYFWLERKGACCCEAADCCPPGGGASPKKGDQEIL